MRQQRLRADAAGTHPRIRDEQRLRAARKQTGPIAEGRVARDDPVAARHQPQLIDVRCQGCGPSPHRWTARQGRSMATGESENTAAQYPSAGMCARQSSMLSTDGIRVPAGHRDPKSLPGAGGSHHGRRRGLVEQNAQLFPVECLVEPGMEHRAHFRQHRLEVGEMLEVAIHKQVDFTVAEKSLVRIREQVRVHVGPAAPAGRTLSDWYFGAEKLSQGEAAVTGIGTEIVQQTQDVLRIAVSQAQRETILK